MAEYHNLLVLGNKLLGQTLRKHKPKFSSWSLIPPSLGLSFLTALVGGGSVIIGVDDTIERRWGRKVFGRGIYRDPVRFSRGHFAKASGLRWLCFMLLTPLPWKRGVKALPFLSLLARRNAMPVNAD